MKARTGETFAPRRGPTRLQLTDRRYSRFVHRTKIVLPAAAVALLLLVAVWPRLEATFDSVRFSLPRLDLTEARELHMVKARFTGVDRENRPFVVTAAVARQQPKLDGLITLEQPKGDLTMVTGSWLELSADTGLYQTQPQLLDLFGNVALFQDRGNEFHSTSAHVNMDAGTAEGDDPVTGQGPFGNITAQGFRILDRGTTILFTGHATLNLLPRTGADK